MTDADMLFGPLRAYDECLCGFVGEHGAGACRQNFAAPESEALVASIPGDEVPCTCKGGSRDPDCPFEFWLETAEPRPKGVTLERA